MFGGEKGKEKEGNHDEWEINPVVTYRHILANTPSVQ